MRHTKENLRSAANRRAYWSRKNLREKDRRINDAARCEKYAERSVERGAFVAEQYADKQCENGNRRAEQRRVDNSRKR
jgi:hypothetical protein